MTDAADQLAVAEATARRIMASDHVSPSLGIELEHIGVGTATISMTATSQMVNGFDLVHGGFIFVLADCAFALASNSHGVDVVARSCEIEFVAPARLGDRLIATATERRLLPRAGIYDVAVTLPGGELIAEFRGHGRQYRAG